MGRAFEKVRNWYGPVDDEDPDVAKLQKKLATISDNDSNPHAGQKVFEIKTRPQATKVEEVEAAEENPRGTVDNPVPVPANPERRSHTADEVESGSEDAAPARRGRRRGGE